MVIESLSLIALCIASLIYAHNHHSDIDSDSVEYISITSMVATISFIYFALDSILLENIFQLYASICLHAVITTYLIWHYVANDLGTVYNHVSLFAMISVCVFQFIYTIMGPILHNKFGWRLYKKIGGNIAIRPLYRTTQVFFTLLKLDFVFTIIIILLATFYYFTQTVQIIINILISLLSFIWIILGFYCIQSESVKLFVVFVIISILSPSYMLYKLFIIRFDSDTDYSIFSWRQLLFTCILAAIIRIGVIVFSVLCYKNFGFGLKDKVFGAESDRVITDDVVLHIPDGENNNNTNDKSKQLLGPELPGAPPRPQIQQQSNNEESSDGLVEYVKPLCNIL